MEPCSPLPGWAPRRPRTGARAAPTPPPRPPRPRPWWRARWPSGSRCGRAPPPGPRCRCGAGAARRSPRHFQPRKLPEDVGAAAHHAVVPRAGGALVQVHLHLHPLFPGSASSRKAEYPARNRSQLVIVPPPIACGRSSLRARASARR
jgi:hypothetical protein